MEAKLKYYIILRSNGGKVIDTNLIVCYSLEEAFEAVKQTANGESERMDFLKAIDYDEFQKVVNKSFNLKDEPPHPLPAVDLKPLEKEIKTLNKTQNINYLKLIQNKVGNVKLSTAINKLK